MREPSRIRLKAQYEQDKAVVRRLRAWLKKNATYKLAGSNIAAGQTVVDLDAFLSAEKARIPK